MNRDLLDRLRCPRCKHPLAFAAQPVEEAGEICSGSLDCRECQSGYQIVDFIPRFVPADNYASSFGFQWNRFRQTQLDRYSKTTISRSRFLRETGWDADALDGRDVLDAGCGAGRFAEIALSLGANLYAIDYSRAVDACRENLKDSRRLHVFQADIYNLPFAEGSFDFIYSLGVLQHTPDPRAALLALIRHLKAGGHIAVDFYGAGLLSRLHPKYLLRPLSTRVSQSKLFQTIERAAPYLLPISNAVGALPLIGGALRRMVPIANYQGQLPLDAEQMKQWAILDTFDWLSPTYDNPESPDGLFRTLECGGLQDIQVKKIGHLVGSGRRPLSWPRP